MLTIPESVIGPSDQLSGWCELLLTRSSWQSNYRYGMVAKCFCSTVWTSRLSRLSGFSGLSRHLDYRPLPLITVYITHHLVQGRATNSTQLIDKFFDILVTVLVSVHLKSQTNFSNFLQENVGNNLPFLTFRPWRYREKQMTYHWAMHSGSYLLAIWTTQCILSTLAWVPIQTCSGQLFQIENNILSLSLSSQYKPAIWLVNCNAMHNCFR